MPEKVEVSDTSNNLSELTFQSTHGQLRGMPTEDILSRCVCSGGCNASYLWCKHRLGRMTRREIETKIRLIYVVATYDASSFWYLSVLPEYIPMPCRWCAIIRLRCELCLSITTDGAQSRRQYVNSGKLPMVRLTR